MNPYSNSPGEPVESAVGTSGQSTLAQEPAPRPIPGPSSLLPCWSPSSFLPPFTHHNQRQDADPSISLFLVSESKLDLLDSQCRIVNDLTAAREFYGGLLQCPEGRSADRWIDFSLYGHQIVAHLSELHPYVDHINPVDGDEVPVPHFGVVLGWQEFEELAERLKAAGIKFIVQPHVRFQGLAGEQYTMFFKDPAGNNLEFKAMANPDYLFQKQ